MSILFAILVLVSIISIYAAVTPYSCPSCVRTRVGAAQFVYGPVGAPLDNAFFSLIANGTVLGYSANGDTQVIVNGGLSSVLASQTTALYGGIFSSFDECGSWLNSAVIDGKVVRGWYHAECSCDYDIGQTYKSIAYCESSDGGRTFKKLKYPANQVITGYKPFTAGATTGNGDHTVINGNDGYYYMFFINWDDYGHCVARASVSSGGVPGSWYKYYNGLWTQPGIGGASTALYNLAGTTVYLHSSGNFVGIGSGNGITLSFGSNVINWASLPDPIVFTEASQWTRTSNSSELLGYPALVPIGGGNGVLNNTYWLYYTYLQPGAYFSQRYLVRRAVTMTILAADDGAPQAGVELSKWISGSITWTTTTLPITSGFVYSSSMGYLLTAPHTNAVPIYDCYIVGWNDYILTTYRGDCITTNGIVFNRHLGYIYNQKQTVISTSALYRCFNSKILKHFVTHSSACEGTGTLEYIIGWTMDN